MATPNIQLAPMQVTNGAGLFQLESGGYVQGFQMPDPAYRYDLSQGILAPTQTKNMIPGAAISVAIPNSILGGNITRATAAANISGFSVGNQAYNGIITPTAAVPVQGSRMSVQYVLLGTGARIVVGISPGLAATLLSGAAPITTQVSWDFQNQQLVPYAPAYPNNTISDAVWAATGGGQTTFTVASDPTSILTPGDVINVTGVVSTGVGFNGTFTVVSTTSSTIVVSQPAASSPGTYTSGGLVLAGGGAVPVKILGVNAGNSQQIYEDANGLFQWNPNGNAALIQV